MEGTSTDGAVQPPAAGGISITVPAAIARAGAAGAFAWDEFFSGQLRNKHTRAAYLYAVRRFLAWVEPQERDLARITPGLVGRYFDQQALSIPSKKLHLSALRRFFDLLVQRHVIILNPALSVRTERYSVGERKTPEITTGQARMLLDSIVLRSVADYRDQAIVATLIFTAARAGAVARLRVRDLVEESGQYVFKFQEKGGRHRSIPVRHDLQTRLLEYLGFIDARSEERDAPLFRTLTKSGGLSDRGVSGIDICRTIKRRLRAAGLPPQISPHSFRACTATDLLLQGVLLEDVQYLLGHADARVTRLYDRRQRQVTRSIVERISI